LSLFVVEGPAAAAEFDDASLVKMTMGDQEMMARILASFKSDCEDDMLLLKESLTANNQPQARLVVHRLAGRIAQIGAKDLGAAFRTLEQKIAAADLLDAAIEADIKALLAQLQSLLTAVALRINSAFV